MLQLLHTVSRATYTTVRFALWLTLRCEALRLERLLWCIERQRVAVRDGTRQARVTAREELVLAARRVRRAAAQLASELDGVVEPTGVSDIYSAIAHAALQLGATAPEVMSLYTACETIYGVAVMTETPGRG